MNLKKVILSLGLVLTIIGVARAQFSIQPAESGTSWFLYTMNPGSTISSHALATNTYPDTREFSLYVVDATVEKKTEAFLPHGKDQEGAILREWIRLPQSHLRIPGKTGVKVPFTIQVPPTATAGEYVGALMIQEDLGPRQPGQSGGQVSVATSVGARMYITVKSGGVGVPAAQRAYQSGNTESVFSDATNGEEVNGLHLISDIERLVVSGDAHSDDEDTSNSDEYRWILNVLLLVIIVMAGLLFWRRRQG